MEGKGYEIMNEFKVEGKIIEIKEDRTILLKVAPTTIVTVSCDSKIKIEKYSIGEMVEILGYITTYKPLLTICLIATKITRKD